MYNHHRPTPLLRSVADSLKVTKGQKAPKISEHDVQGLAAFDSSLYENQHKHGSHKQVLQSLDRPVVEVTTQKISEHKPHAIVDGVQLSPEQLINYQRGELR
jgi:hypothetical protein